MTERITHEQTRKAIEIAARVSGLPLELESHGTIGDRQGYSVSFANTGSRLSPIGNLREVYYYAHLITDTTWALKNAADRRLDLATVGK